MPDQLPSAILDSTNSLDSIFALNLDTKQRFDNILSGVQKPIDYPLPEYDSSLTPAGFPQDYLLNPNKMAGTIGEALFSPDPKVASYATDKMRSTQSKLPVNQGIGVVDRFPYAKEMDKYLNGDYGYNPYMSMEDNEDFNYRYDYLSSNVVSRVFKNIGTGLGRFGMSVLLKLGQTVGYMGSMVGNGIEEIINPKENNFMSDVADNSLSRWFEGLEEDMKNSNLLSVFKPRGWEDRGFFNKLGHGAFWTDEVADGAAFMGEMVASMYLLGGLGRVAGLGKLGATEINLAKSLSKLGPLGNYSGKGLNLALKTTTGADDLSGIGRWAFSVTSESAFEASGIYKTRKEKLEADRRAGINEYSDMEIDKIAGDSAAASFKANMMILSASNAFENKFIYGPLFKKMGLSSPNPRGRLIDVSKSTENLHELPRASRRKYDYKTWIGKSLNWKNSNSRLRFYGSRGLSAVAAEGFWEENAQLAVERLASADALSFSTFLKKISEQTLNALRGDDPEAATNIGLGAIIGAGASTVVSKVRGGDGLFQGERRKIEADTIQAVNVYEEFRKAFLNYNDIYKRDGTGRPITDADGKPQLDADGKPILDGTGKPILDANGNLQIDEVRAAALLDGTNQFLSKQAAADKVTDPLFRKHLQDLAMSHYVEAAKMAGIYDRVLQRFDTVKSITPAELENLGFDPNTTVDAAYLKDSLEQFGKIYDSVENAPSARLKKGQTEADERRRKSLLYTLSTGVYSATKLLGEYNSKMLDRDFPSVFSPEAQGNTSEVQQYNSLVYQKEALQQFEGFASENGTFFNGFIEYEKKRIAKEMDRLQEAINLMEAADPDTADRPVIMKNARGLYFSPDKYEGYTDTEVSLIMAVENDPQKKHAEYTNIRNRNQYLVNKIGNPEKGIQNTIDYFKFYEEVQKKDAEADKAVDAEVEVEVDETPAEQAAPATPVPVVEKKIALKSQELITALRKQLTNEKAKLDAGNDPNYNLLITLIEENQNDPDKVKVIQSELLAFITPYGDVVSSQIDNNIFEKDSPSQKAYEIAAEFVNNVLQGDVSGEVANDIIDYTDSIDEKINSYVPPVVQFTPIEQNAIDLITAKPELNNSIVGPYTKIISDPNVTDAQKRQALRELSDQYLSPTTRDEVGPVLGPEIRDAIDALGYPVPVLPSEEVQSEAAQSNTSEARTEEVVTDKGQLPAEELLQMAKVKQTTVFYDRGQNKFIYRTPKGKETSYNQARKVANTITPRFFRVWYTELSNSSQRSTIENINTQLLNALYEAQVGQHVDTIELVLMRNLRNMKFSPSILKNLTDVSISTWSSEDAEPVDTFVSDFLLGEGNILEQNGFVGFNEQDLLNMIYGIIEQYPNGIRVKDIKDKEKEDNPVSKLEDLEKDFFEQTGLDLIKSLEIYNNERQDLDSKQAKIPEPVDVSETDLISNNDIINKAKVVQKIADGTLVLDKSEKDMVNRVAVGTGSQDDIDAVNHFYEAATGSTIYIDPEIKRELDEKANQLLSLWESGRINLSDTEGEIVYNIRKDYPKQEEVDSFNLVYDSVMDKLKSETAEEGKLPPSTQDPSDTEGSGIEEPPPPEPPTPQAPENSEEASGESDNYIDVIVDTMKLRGGFAFPQNMPEEIIMEGDKAKIVNGAIQLKTTHGDQQTQLLRQHNILKYMGERTNPDNFWAEDEDGNPKYKIKLEFAGEKNKDKYEPWIYQTGKGLINKKTGKLNKFPYIVAMVVDQQGNYVYFNNEGKVTDKTRGLPFGFVYTVEDYYTDSLHLSRRGLQLGTGEYLSGPHGFLTRTPLDDISTALQRGANILGTIDTVASGKLSTYNVDNSGATYAKVPDRRTVKQMEEAGDITETSPIVLVSGQYYEYSSSSTPGAPTQQIKVGQPYLVDDRTGIKIPLRGKLIKDLTLDGKPLITDDLREVLEKLSKDRQFTLTDNISQESIAIMQNLYNFIKALVYSQNTPVFLSEDGGTIHMLDQRPDNKSLLDTEVNYSTNITILNDPFDTESEGFSYESLVKENFLSGAVPAELTKGQKNFEKLNRRIIFVLDKDHSEILDVIGAKANVSKTVRMKSNDYTKFVNKSYKRRDSDSTITVTGYSNGNFTIVGPKGEVTQSVDSFMRNLRTLEEVTIPPPSPEVRDDFENNIKLSEDKQRELNNKAKNMSKDDLDNLNFDC